MKANSTGSVQRCVVAIALVVVLLAKINIAAAQLPECVSGNNMYGVFNNVAGSTTADSMEIRPINASTGAVGALVAGRKYWVRKQIGATWYYGSAALGVDMITNRFYVNTQMSSAGQKDFITINGVTGAMTVIGTTPVSLDNYHFVKMAFSPTGVGYALGVRRDSSGSAATFNPLIRFTTCGALPTPGCSTIELLGYLPSTGLMYKWLLFNGDIAFDSGGNLYFATAAFERVGTIMRYTDARLFTIAAADIPASAGVGTIPMSLVAEYDGLDSTVVNGIAFTAGGNMHISTRRFLGVQTAPAGPSNSELYASPTPGNANLIGGFGPITPSFSIGDIASCYFPFGVLANNKIQLKSKYETGKVNLKWEVNNNSDISYFEVERSDDGYNFKTISTISPDNTTNASAKYSYNDPQNGFDKNKFYRIREVMRVGSRVYSNVAKISFNNNINLITKVGPNPFTNHFDLNVQLRSAKSLTVQLKDGSGRTVYSNGFNGQAGENKVRVDGIASLRKGVYIVEVSTEDEVIREKLVKQ